MITQTKVQKNKNKIQEIQTSGFKILEKITLETTITKTILNCIIYWIASDDLNEEYTIESSEKEDRVYKCINVMLHQFSLIPCPGSFYFFFFLLPHFQWQSFCLFLSFDKQNKAWKQWSISIYGQPNGKQFSQHYVYALLS